MAKRRRRRANPVDAWNEENEDHDHADVLNKIEACLKRIDDAPAELWDEGYDFFQSIEDKLKSIHETIERTRRVSLRQNRAIDNMIEGVGKWFKD